MTLNDPLFSPRRKVSRFFLLFFEKTYHAQTEAFPFMPNNLDLIIPSTSLEQDNNSRQTSLPLYDTRSFRVLESTITKNFTKILQKIRQDVAFALFNPHAHFWNMKLYKSINVSANLIMWNWHLTLRHRYLSWICFVGTLNWTGSLLQAVFLLAINEPIMRITLKR